MNPVQPIETVTTLNFQFACFFKTIRQNTFWLSSFTLIFFLIVSTDNATELDTIYWYPILASNVKQCILSIYYGTWNKYF